jgi:hypothetical protein
MADFLGGFDTLLGNSSMPGTGIQDDSIHSYFHASVGEGVSKVITLGGTGATSLNIFQLTGTVEVLSLHGFITAAATLTNMTGVHFELWDSTAAVDLTKTMAR